MKKLCVIGSLNIDVVTSVDRFPLVGETVPSHTFDIFVGGGKGANQAVALGRLGADVRMVGKLGDKFYGPQYMQVLKDNHVKCDTVVIEKDAFPGTAIVAVDKNSDNILFAFPGTNGMVTIDFIEEQWPVISTCDLFLLQLEIPLETNLHAMAALKEAGKTIIFDPAPARDIPDEIYRCINYITPNETELKTLSGIMVGNDPEDIRKAAGVLIGKGASTVIAKAGKRGAYIITQNEFSHVPGFPVDAVDPTAAGDSFNAGFSYALASGEGVFESVRFANAVGALSTTALGAQSAMPTLDQVKRFITERE